MKKTITHGERAGSAFWADEKKSRIVAVVVFAVSLVVNGLASTTLLGGNTTAEVSDAYPNLFAPAGVTFAIWGVIYLLLIAFCVRLFVRVKGSTKETAALMHPLMNHFVVVNVLNAVWLFAWQYRVLWLSVLLIIAMLVTLIRISALFFDKKMVMADWVTLKLPFSIYFGWITVATIANITTFLVSTGWDGGGVSPEIWTVVMLLVGAAIGMTTAFRRHDWPYLAVFVWANFGIWLKHISPNGHDNQYAAVIALLLALLPLMVVRTGWLAYQWPKGIDRRGNKRIQE